VTRTRLAATTALAALVLLAACGGGSDGGGGSDAGDARGGTAMTGLFRVTAGSCATAPVGGSWFRMVQPGGTVAAGPYVSNQDSACADKGFTDLRPGADGGLVAGRFQPQPDPPFTDQGSSSAAAIVEPQGFFAVAFGASTQDKDPQTGKTVPAPSVRRTGSTLTADLSAFSVSWNRQQFNQGAPKPGGGAGRATGSYDEATGAYSLEWTSVIDGGPFDRFTGVWHLEGRFEAA
jgi:hypothetical protein